MNESAPNRSNDPRLEAALEDYFNRLDRNESVDRDSFLAEHRQIAAELRQFIATEDEIRKFAAESRGDISQESTGSFSQHANETLPPRPLDSAGGTKPGELSGNFGRYRILRSLGQGAMGTVYLAEDTQLRRQIALKTPQFAGGRSAGTARTFLPRGAGRRHVATSLYLPRLRCRRHRRETLHHDGLYRRSAPLGFRQPGGPADRGADSDRRRQNRAGPARSPRSRDRAPRFEARQHHDRSPR